MEVVLEVAKEHNLFVVEDNCQGIGADLQISDGQLPKIWNYGNYWYHKFFPSKNLGCYGDGGAIFTNDDELAYKMRGIVNHGMYKRYYHDEVGVNSRLDSVQAAVLRVKLPLLDSYNAARRSAADYYDKAFCESSKYFNTEKSRKLYSRFPSIYTQNFERKKKWNYKRFSRKKEIPAMIYYPVALRKQKPFTKSLMEF